MSRRIYRKVALDRLASPEQLDQLLVVTNVRVWLVLVGIFIILSMLVAWSFVGFLPTRVHGPGILVFNGGVFEVTALERGRLIALDVRVGDEVKEGQVVGRIDQPELEEERDEAKEVLREFESRHELLSRFAVHDRRMNREAMLQQRATLKHAIRLAKERRGWLEARLESQEELLKHGLITRQALAITRQSISSAKKEASEARGMLKEVDVREAELIQRQEQELSERELQIREQKRKIEALEERLAESSQLVSPRAGRVVEVRSVAGRLVAPGTPVFNLELGHKSEEALEVLVYLPPRDGKKVRPGMTIEIAPSTVRPEEFGRILGVVASVSDFPATRHALMADLANEDLVQGFLDQTGGAPLVVRADLLTTGDANSPTGLRWTSSKGPDMPIYAGTLCTSSVVVRQQHPIEFMVPGIKDAMGL